MNEQRLDELWEETRELCIEWRLSPAMDRKIPSVREEEQFMYKKFAELIVRECADVLIENGDKQFNIRTIEPESHNKPTEWMEGYEEAVKHYGSFLLKKNAKLIKKHFGVEE